MATTTETRSDRLAIIHDMLPAIPTWVHGCLPTEHSCCCRNLEWLPNAYLIRWMPQIHWQACARFQIQAGFGLRHADRHTSAEAATRLIAEF
jgi:hypothetical protein